MEAVTESKSRHPKGLWVLFGTEMWERFNFYGMRAILTLFMVHALMLGESNASIIYGGFLALCYLTPLLGGFISDKYLGNRNCILLGGSLMAIGQLLLFYSACVFDTGLESSKNIFWLGLFVIIFGNGFFKPNISSMVGSLYPPQEKTKLDSAFTIFYMGINIGALLSQYFVPMFADVVVDGKQDVHAFKWGYLMAGIAMILGTVLFFILKNKYVVDPEGKPIGGVPSKNNAGGEVVEQAKFTSASLGIFMVLLVALFFVFRYLLVDELFFSSFEIGTLVKGIIYPIIYASGISLAVLVLLDKTLTKIETQRILVIYIISFFIIFFWAAFEQAGSSLTFIASNQTDRTFLFGWQMPASMVQIFNGIFVVMLAVPFSLLWDKLRAAGKEPVSPLKQAFGLALIALSYFIIAHNVKDLGSSGLLAIKWLILLYFIQTCGELCLSPIGLSLVGKLAPKRFASLLYGVFFISNAAGYALAGILGSILPATGDKFKKAEELGVNLQDVLDKKVTLTADQAAQFEKLQIPTANHTFAGFEIHNLFEFFMVFVVLCGIASVVLALISPFLKKMMNGVK
ncbi:peptide MFS transporter [Elizabethkingia meningoseptica]|uniref:peptide MFS transporter n=1 Tax=Elizabethkingia meningoseptica TaxID=238 RepID=UPI002DD6B5BF|nr:peptide MFS transporter [Elizabethkingia meningoseptica]MEC4710786.1 peptide MFS transporter [Elizabethkingia meningoseptica]